MAASAKSKLFLPPPPLYPPPRPIQAIKLKKREPTQEPSSSSSSSESSRTSTPREPQETSSFNQSLTPGQRTPPRPTQPVTSTPYGPHPTPPLSPSWSEADRWDNLQQFIGRRPGGTGYKPIATGYAMVKKYDFMKFPETHVSETRSAYMSPTFSNEDSRNSARPPTAAPPPTPNAPPPQPNQPETSEQITVQQLQQALKMAHQHLHQLDVQAENQMSLHTAFLQSEQEKPNVPKNQTELEEVECLMN